MTKNTGKTPPGGVPRQARRRRAREAEALLCLLARMAAAALAEGRSPWTPSPLGRRGHSPVGLVACLVYGARNHLTYDGLVDALDAAEGLPGRLGLDRTPSRSSLQAAAARTDPAFMAWALSFGGIPGSAGALMGDSTGASLTVLEEKIGARGRAVRAHGYCKLHVLCTPGGLVTDFELTPGSAGDAPVMLGMLRRAPRGAGFVLLDTAYCSEAICRAIMDAGRMPVVRSKDDAEAHGFGPRAEMIRHAREHPKGFWGTYNHRNIVEALFSSLKRRGHGLLRSRLPSTRLVEMASALICHNAHVLAPA